MANLSDTSCLIMKTYLVAKGLFTLPSLEGTWPLYETSLPDGINVEDNAASVNDSQDVINSRDMSSGENFKHYGIMILIRALDYEIGWLKAKSVLTDLCAVHNVPVSVGANSYTLGAVTKNSGILNLGTESGTKRRYKFELSFNVTLEEV